MNHFIKLIKIQLPKMLTNLKANQMIQIPKNVKPTTRIWEVESKILKQSPHSPSVSLTWYFLTRINETPR